jgi:hypothetical protein
MVARGKCERSEHAAPGAQMQKRGSPEKGKRCAIQHDFCRPLRPETLRYAIQGLRFACPWLPYLRASGALSSDF